MKKRLALAALLAVLSVSLYFAADYFQNTVVLKLFYSAATLFATYVVIKILVETIIAKSITESKTRYSMRKIFSLLFVLIFIAGVITIWVPSIEALLVSYGVLAAGAAVALQDVFKNFAGGIIIFITGMYRVGDRIEVNGKTGDVIDIGVFYTTLLETNEWIKGDQATGRLSTIPNGAALNSVVNNFNRDHPYIWDEISIPVTYESDWKEALKIIKKTVESETKEITAESERSLSKLSNKYYLPARATGPMIIVSLTSNWINFDVRYITEVRQRRTSRDHLTERLIDRLQKAKNVRIASESMNISVREFPGKKTRV